MQYVQNMGITPKVTLIFVLFAVLLQIGGGLVSYLSGRAALQAATISDLVSTATEKEAALEAWLLDQQSSIEAVARLPRVKAESALLTAVPDSSQADTAYDRLVADLDPWVGENRGFLSLMIIEPETGKVIAATDSREEGKFKEDRLYFINGRHGPMIQNPYYSLAMQGPAMTAAAPIVSEEGRLLGVLAGRLNLVELNAIINRRSGLRQTTEAYLVNKSNLFVTQPHLSSDPAVLQQGVRTEAVTACLAGQNGVILADDYRQLPTIAVHRWLAERELCLVVKIDQAEAFAPIRTFGQTTTLVGGLALLGASVLAVWLGRTITRPVLALQTGAARFGEGKLDMRLPETSSDELGLLGQTFNTMAARLQAAIGSLEQRVAERTQALALANAELEAEIAERRQIEQRLRHLAAIVETSDDAIIAKDLTGQITSWNQAAERLYGYTAGEVIGRSIEIIVPDERRDELRQIMEMIKRGEGIDHIETVRMARDGRRIDVSLTLSPLRDHEGRLIGASAIARNITERKRIEHELQQHRQQLEVLVAERTAEHQAANEQLQDEINERRRVEEALRQSEERFRVALKNSSVIVSHVDRELRYTWIYNPHLDFSEEDALGKRDDELAPYENVAGLIEFKRDILERGEGDRREISFPLSDGSMVYDVTGEPVRDDSGEVIGLTVAAFEITEQKRVEEKFQGLLETAPDAIVIVNEQGNIALINVQTETLFGYTRSELIGQPVELLIPERYRSNHVKFRHGYIAEPQLRPMGQGLELYGRRKDGSEFPVEISLGPLKTTEGLLISSVIRDVTQQVEARQALRSSEERHRTLLENSPDIIARFDKALRTIYVNRVVEEELGLSRDQIIGKTHDEVGLPEAETKPRMEAVREVFETGVQTTIYSSRETEAGMRYYHSIFVPEFGPDGSVETVLTITRNITEQKQNEAQLKTYQQELKEHVAALARSNRELEQFAYVASHDLQEPLRMVSSFVQLLARRYQGQLDDDADEFIHYAVDGANRMRQLINDLLTFSRVNKQDQAFEPLDCEAILDETLTNLQTAIQESQAVITHDPLPTVLGIKVQVRQLFQNLIGNALKFQNEQPPEIHIGVERRAGDKHRAGAEHRATEWLFWVRDNGIGIEPDNLERIFDIFKRGQSQEQYAGTGIGLAVCKKIVELHGGRIWVESEIGRGSTFYFTIDAGQDLRV